MRASWAAIAFFGLASTACPTQEAPIAPADAGSRTVYIETGADEKQILYNLIGRWYPQDEIKRLSDRSLTAREWCATEPAMIFIVPEKVEIHCSNGQVTSAAIASTKREKDGVVSIGLRSTEEKLKNLRILARGPAATITGNPCFEGAVEYARFPEYEIIARDMLGGQRCAQLAAEATEKGDLPSLNSP